MFQILCSRKRGKCRRTSFGRYKPCNQRGNKHSFRKRNEKKRATHTVYALDWSITGALVGAAGVLGALFSVLFLYEYPFHCLLFRLCVGCLASLLRIVVVVTSSLVSLTLVYAVPFFSTIAKVTFHCFLFSVFTLLKYAQSICAYCVPCIRIPILSLMDLATKSFDSTISFVVYLGTCCLSYFFAVIFFLGKAINIYFAFVFLFHRKTLGKVLVMFALFCCWSPLVSAVREQELQNVDFVAANSPDSTTNLGSQGSAFMSAAEYTIGRRIVEGTKDNYRGKINTMKLYMMDKGLFHLIDQQTNNIIVPLPDDIIQDMFGWISTNTDLPLQSRRKKPVKNKKNAGASKEGEGEQKQSFQDSDTDEDNDNENDGDCSNENVQQEGPADLFAQGDITIAVSTMQGYKSALKWMYSEAHVLFTREMDDWLDRFILGYRKIVAEKKLKGIMSIAEGKQPISFSGFCYLCYVLMTLVPKKNNYPWKVSVFGWSFETMAWNIIGRCSNVHALMLQHFDWREDALLVTVPKHKGDQTGNSLSQQKHVYANPLQPQICPILALAVLIICRHRMTGAQGQAKQKQRLYTEDSKQRFGTILGTLLNDYELIPEDVNLGAARRSDLGTHSYRKGAATYLCGLSICLSAVNIFLRAGWSVGAVQDRYIFAGTGGDQVVGRAATGLPINNRDFAILPPHFTSAGMDRVRSIGLANLVEGFESFPRNFQRVVPFLLASVVYHQNYLRQHLHAGHPLWNQRIFVSPITVDGRVFQNGAKALEGLAVCGWDRDDDTSMQATGIPSHVLLANELSDIKRKIETSLGDINNRLQRVEEALAALPTDLQSTLPKALSREIMDHFQIEGVIPLTYADVVRLLDERQSTLLQHIDRLATTPRTTDETTLPSPPTTGQELQLGHHSVFQYFQWGGVLQCFVPEGFKFPMECDIKTMWNLWYFGNGDLKIHPYRKMSPYINHDLDKPGRERHSRAKRIMGLLEKEIVRLNLVDGGIDGIASLSMQEADAVFMRAFEELITQLYPDRQVGRALQVSIDTLCNRIPIVKRNKRKAEDQQALLQLAAPQAPANPPTTFDEVQQLMALTPLVTSDIPTLAQPFQPATSNFASMFGLRPAQRNCK